MVLLLELIKQVNKILLLIIHSQIIMINIKMFKKKMMMILIILKQTLNPLKKMIQANLIQIEKNNQNKNVKNLKKKKNKNKSQKNFN